MSLELVTLLTPRFGFCTRLLEAVTLLRISAMPADLVLGNLHEFLVGPVAYGTAVAQSRAEPLDPRFSYGHRRSVGLIEASLRHGTANRG